MHDPVFFVSEFKFYASVLSKENKLAHFTIHRDEVSLFVLCARPNSLDCTSGANSVCNYAGRKKNATIRVAVNRNFFQFDQNSVAQRTYCALCFVQNSSSLPYHLLDVRTAYRLATVRLSTSNSCLKDLLDTGREGLNK